jgi:hypothetical protein
MKDLCKLKITLFFTPIIHSNILTKNIQKLWDPILFTEHLHCTLKLIIKYHLTIITLISEMRRLDTIRQLFKFNSPFDKPRQRWSEKLITEVSF